MRRLTITIAAPLLLVLVVAASATNPPTHTLKHVNRPIAAVAMDGSRIAYVTDGTAVQVWNVQSGRTVRLRDGSGQYVEHPMIPEVAIAGTRVAWITLDVTGNSQETWARLYTKSLTTGTRLAQRVTAAYRSDGYDERADAELWKGDWLTGLVGSGDLLAVSRWTTKPSADFSDVTVSNARLSLIDPRRPLLRVIAAGEQAIVSASADGSRIAVLRRDDSVGIYSSSGTLLKQITPSTAREIAYGGGRLVVLTDTNTLEVYDSQKGRLLHTWPIHKKAVSSQPGNLRAYRRIAVYFADTRAVTQNMYLIDLATGKTLVLPTGEHSWGTPGAAVGQLGLAYSVNTYRSGGTLIFLPTARVLSMIRSG